MPCLRVCAALAWQVFGPIPKFAAGKGDGEPLDPKSRGSLVGTVEGVTNRLKLDTGRDAQGRPSWLPPLASVVQGMDGRCYLQAVTGMYRPAVGVTQASII